MCLAQLPGTARPRINRRRFGSLRKRKARACSSNESPLASSVENLAAVGPSRVHVLSNAKRPHVDIRFGTADGSSNTALLLPIRRRWRNLVLLLASTAQSAGCGRMLRATANRETRFREPPCTLMVELVDRICSGIEPYLDMPFSFFGHSMGALICFELARTLEW